MELAALTSLYSNVSDSDDEKDERSATPATKTTNGTKEDEGEFGGSLEYVSQPAFKRAKIQSAPEVQPLIAKNAILHDPAKKEIHYNPRYEDMSLPVIGPIQPFNPHSLDRNKNCWTGRIDETDINHVVFDMNFIDSHRSQRAISSSATADSSQERKRKREERGDPGTEEYRGPWAKYDVRDEYKKLEEMQQKNLEEFQTKQQQEALDLSTRSSSSSSDAPSDPSSSSSSATPSVVAVPEFKRKHSPSEPGYEKTIFHGTQLRDYQGRTYMSPPSDQKLAAFDHASFLPKKKIHTWTGHTKGVQAIRMLPGTAHLLLSGGLDGKVKLWDLYNDRHVLRTFNGHSKGIKDISFSNDGRRFLTASADSWIKLWDTETGQCITQLSNEKIPFCCKFNPDEDKQNEFLTGCNDKRIYQWDLRTKETIQEYNRHLNTVNSITFIDSNRRFVSTSDDKMIRVWEYGIPVDIKLISDPSMHSMPFVAVHPSGKWMACQSMDNQILLYSTNDRFKLNRKKRFSGHIVSGYACQIHFSPDGRFVISGDASGNLFIWDWKSAKIYKKIQCHKAVTIGCLWHPHEPSRVITCSWDGCIHYWD